MTKGKIRSPLVMIIANPIAGGFNLKKTWEHQQGPLIKTTLGRFDHVFTQKPGDATTLTRKALKAGYGMIVAMGGDGTLNEVVNGFFDNTQPVNPDAALGILPFGSGGDFIRTLGFDRHFRQALQHLCGTQTRMVDVGRIAFADPGLRDRYFINIAEIGLGASIMKHVNAKSRKWPALFRYLTGTVQGFAGYNNIPVRISLYPQGKQKVALTNLIVANGQYFGRGMRPAPQAVLDDGLFDVVIIKNLTWRSFLLNLPQMYSAKKLVSSHIMEQFRANKIEIDVLEKGHVLCCEVDGETHGFGNMTLSLLPKAVKIKV